MRYFKIYTKDGCSHCVNAKALIKSYGFEYEELNLSEDESILDLFKLINWQSFPLVCELTYSNDGHVRSHTIGGFTDLKDYLDDEL